MNDPLDSLKSKWDQAKGSSDIKPSDSSTLIASAQKKMKSVVYSHYGNILVLSLTVIMLCAFFYYITPFKDLLSHVGVAAMIGGLLIRIAIEIYSINKSKQIDLSDSAANTNASTLNFYAYRKRIHGPVTITILIAYTIGFYMLTPEFSKYLSFNQVLLMDSSYLVIAAILIFLIRKGIRDEMRLLNELTSFGEEFKEQ